MNYVLFKTSISQRNTMANEKYFTIIPVYEPEKVLLSIINQILNSLPNVLIIVVNDGSVSISSKIVLDEVSKLKKVILINHLTNKGKGAALKTAFKYLLDQKISFGSVVTADGDGQHLVSDIIKVIKESYRLTKPILGVRGFDHRTPFRSFLGNKITSFIFKFITGKKILDTQTGLRAFPARDLHKLSQISGERYEYETRQLIEFWCNISFKEMKINTIYVPKNPSSHFHPLIDSMKIYWVLMRHLFVSSIIGCVDFFILLFFLNFGANAATAVAISRLTSCIFYFYAIKKSVFQQKSNSLVIIIKFALNIGINILLFPLMFIELSKSTESTVLPLFSTYIIFSSFNFLFQKFFVFRE